MQTITLKAYADRNGIVKLEVPTSLVDREVEIVVVIQASTSEPVDNMGYPVGYFEETYGSFVNDPLERQQPREPDTRDVLE